jgi:hypothetical protein
MGFLLRKLSRVLVAAQWGTHDYLAVSWVWGVPKVGTCRGSEAAQDEGQN